MMEIATQEETEVRVETKNHKLALAVETWTSPLVTLALRVRKRQAEVGRLANLLEVVAAVATENILESKVLLGQSGVEQAI